MEPSQTLHLARPAHERSDSIVTTGYSPYSDHDWISAICCGLIVSAMLPTIQGCGSEQFFRSLA